MATSLLVFNTRLHLFPLNLQREIIFRIHQFAKKFKRFHSSLIRNVFSTTSNTCVAFREKFFPIYFFLSESNH